MGLFNIFKRDRGGSRPAHCQGNDVPGWLSSMIYGGGTGWVNSRAMLLSTVYRCVDVISDSVAQLPLEPYRVDDNGYRRKHVSHPTWYLLNKEPESRMSRFTFLKALVASVLLKGNGYALIERDGQGNAVALRYLQSGDVTVHDLPEGIYYGVNGFDRFLEASEMIHVLNFTYDGINGIPTLEHARQTLELSNDSEAHARGFFKGGGNMSGIICVEGVMKESQMKSIRESWEKNFNPRTGSPNGIAVLQGNMKYQPISVNPADAQLLDTRKFNVVDICRFFSVSPVKAFDLSNSSYSTVEATQLAFLTDTLAPQLEKIELEFGRKIYKPSERRRIEVKFDTSVLLRADKSSQAAYYNALFQIGAITPNEIRRGLDMEPVEGGDNAFCQVNVQTLKQAVENRKPKTESGKLTTS